MVGKRGVKGGSVRGRAKERGGVGRGGGGAPREGGPARGAGVGEAPTATQHQLLERTASERVADGLGAGVHDHRGALVACLLYTSPSPRDRTRSRMPSSA